MKKGVTLYGVNLNTKNYSMYYLKNNYFFPCRMIGFQDMYTSESFYLERESYRD